MKYLTKNASRLLAFLLCMILFVETVNLPAFAKEAAIQNKETSSDSVILDYYEDSTFELVNSDVQAWEEYGSDSDYISEVPISDPGLVNSEATSITPGMARADQMVLMIQKWLNQEYGDVSGFGSVAEDGITGWGTIYGLLRALQHELGITSLANSFGPTTSALYEQNILYRQDGVTDRKFAILQAALWCKGYCPGYYISETSDGIIVIQEVFNESVEQAVIQLKQDAGIEDPDGVVTLNVMKALMSMDSFKLLSAYGGRTEVREMQQRINNKYEAYTGLIPCDGIYGRDTNKALIYALQAEEGLPVNVANGNFGPTTKLCCPIIPYAKSSTAARRYPGNSSGSLYTANQISAITELLQFALFVNGYGDNEIDGVYDAGTQQAIRDFQKAYALPTTGKADLATWLSLFLSSGDTSRSALACDCATILTAEKAKTLYDNGYRYVGRYLTGTYNGGVSKAITAGEASIIFDAGLRFFPIYQTSANALSYFTESQGTADAKAAIAAASALGVPQNAIIYFAVDFDATDYQVTSHIIPYFQKIYETMSGSIYRTGIYGTRNACSRVSEMGYACSSFVGNMSTGYSGNLGYAMPDNWAFDQFTTISIGSGDGYIEIDKDGFSGRDHGVSRLDATVAPPVEIPDINFGTSGSDVLYGPTISILGAEVPLFSLDISLDSELLGLDIQTSRNLVEGTYEIVYGLPSEDDDTTLKNEDYAEIKQLVNAFGGKTTTATWNNFQKMRSKLNKLKLNLGFEFDASVAGFAKFDTKTSNPTLIEGGLCLVAETECSLKYPLGTLIYAKFELEGSVETGLTFVLTETGTLDATGAIEVTVTPKLGVEAGCKAANVFAGLSGDITCELDFPYTSLQESFSAEINGNLFLELNVLSWGYEWRWQFAQMQLYPQTIDSQLSNYSISYDDLVLLPAIAQTANSPRVSDPNTIKQNMQVYCLPKIVHLGNGNMFMAFIDDSADRTTENRTMLMYSVFDGTSWSTPQAVNDDGTGDYEPVLYPDGTGGVHIIWQNETVVFDANATYEQMLENTDLYYTYWDGSSFENTSAITSNNTNHEFAHKLAASNDNVSIVWQVNTENDVLSTEGTNTIVRKQLVDGVWQNAEIVVSGIYAINNIDTAYIDETNVVVYSAKTSNDFSTLANLDVFYYNGTDSLQITNDTTPDYSIVILDEDLYWISGNSIVSVATQDVSERRIIAEDIGSNTVKLESVKNAEGSKAIVWAQDNDSSVCFYVANYNSTTNSFDSARPLSNCEGVVRGWDACMLSTGQIEFVYCLAEKETTSESGKPYGRLDLIQTTANEFCDISVNPIATHTGNVKAEQTVVIAADIYNNGSVSVDQFVVDILDNNGAVLQSSVVDQELQVRESGVIEIPYTLPSSITRSTYTVRIIPVDENDILLSDNVAEITFGYSDLVIENIEEIHTENGRQLNVTISNQGFETVDMATLKLLKDGMEGTVVSSHSISQLNPDASIILSFYIEETEVDASVSEKSRTYYLLIESAIDESDYSNNGQEVLVYPDYMLVVTSGTGGTVSGNGIYEKGTEVTIVATPNTGYILEGWYEDGNRLHGISNEYTLIVNSNRNLEARFIPNDLLVTDVEVYGSLVAGDELTFTASTEGGVQPRRWNFYVFGQNDSEAAIFLCEDSVVHFLEWTPTDAGTYTITVCVSDSTGFVSSYSKEFTVE